MNKTIWKRAALMLLCVMTLLAITALPALADDPDDPGAPDSVSIQIMPPNTQVEGSAIVEIYVTDHVGNGLSSIQVRTAEDQEWRDMSTSLVIRGYQYYGMEVISENCTVYVRVEDMDGLAYEKSRYIECFAPAETTEAAADNGGETLPATALTPDGQGTVLDNAYDGDGKEFFTITTTEGEVYYLVIDRQRNSENVYFLKAVSEADLVALTQTETKTGASTGITGLSGIFGSGGGTEAVCTCKDKCAPGEVDASCAVCAQSYTNCKGTEQTGTADPETTGSGNSGAIIVVVIVMLSVAAAGYYFKIYKPKKEMDDAEDLDELTGRAEDEPTVNEDDLDDLPPRRAARSRRGPPKPDYEAPPEPYHGGYGEDEPEEPDYEDE